MPRSFEGDHDATGLRFGVIASRFNDEIVSGLLEGALDCLARHGAADDAVSIHRVPGAFEIPTLAARLIEVDNPSPGSSSLSSPASGRGRRFDALIALGCLLRGDTPHFEFISAQVTTELSRVAVDARFPIAFGVITCNTYDQAVERSSPGTSNKGWEAALAAIEMANLWKQLAEKSE